VAQSEGDLTGRTLRIGAVSYLNARPLVAGLAAAAPEARIVVDVPSRLADGLAAGRLDVALVPSIELLRHPGYRIVSDACVACDGPVQSVKLFCRVPVPEIRTVALHDASRTSATLVRILLARRCGLAPEYRPLPLDAKPEDVEADAILLIGDPGLLASEAPFAEVWDLGQVWREWTGLPFVFAVWIARDGVDSEPLAALLNGVRDEAIAHLDELAHQEGPALGISPEVCLAYFQDHLVFRLGRRERRGLARFARLARHLDLAPQAVPIVPAPIDTSLESMLDGAVAGGRLSVAQGQRLIECTDLAALGQAADAVCRQFHPEPYRTYNVDRNINYTNVCTSGCRFCAFSCASPEDPRAYVLGRDELFAKIRETIALGGDQILLQGGLHPTLDLAWYEQLVRNIHEAFPTVNIHGFSPPEIHHIAERSGQTVREVLMRLRAAGLGSLPGGGAEILVDRVRQKLSPRKVSADGWLDVCRQWHGLGGRGSATMMFGHVETPAERIEHLERLRQLQDETGGFTAFIGWTFQPGHTDLAGLGKVGAFDYLRTLAVCRLYLDNFTNLQASWVTQGLRIGSLALRFGANDLGSLMIEENVVAAAGTSFRASEREIRHAIEQAGFAPRRRNVFYTLVDHPPAEVVL